MASHQLLSDQRLVRGYKTNRRKTMDEQKLTELAKMLYEFEDVSHSFTLSCVPEYENLYTKEQRQEFAKQQLQIRKKILAFVRDNARGV